VSRIQIMAFRGTGGFYTEQYRRFPDLLKQVMLGLNLKMILLFTDFTHRRMLSRKLVVKKICSNYF